MKNLKDCGCVFGEMCKVACFTKARERQRRAKRLRGHTWPMTSMAIACHPRKRKEFMEEAAKRGVPTHFKETGEAVFESAAHQQRYCRAFGYFNKDSNYSPKNL